MSTGLAPAPVYRLPGVQLFASGVYRGQTWTPAAVDAAAENCRKLYALHIPPGVAQPVPEGGVGHDENEDALDWLERTDLPASGVVDPRTVKSIPDPDYPGHKILVGDLVNVPAETAAKIESGEYLTGSAELYPDFLDDFGASHGPALRRYCIMGGWVQQVKRLKRLPKPVLMTAPVAFAESGRKAKSGITYLSFAERTMDAASMIAAVKAAMPGISDAFLSALTPDQLAELVKNLPTAPAAPVAPMDDAATPPPTAMTREEMIAALVAAGQDAAALEAMTDDELKALLESAGTPAAPAPEVAAMGEKGKPSPEMVQATATLNKMTAFAELQHKRLQTQAAQMKRQKVHAFAEQLVKDGRIFPAQRPDYIGQLLALDDLHAVHRFSEAGRNETLTALDRKMRELSKRAPIIRFGEKMPGDATPAQDTKEAAVRKAEQHANTIPDVAWKQSGFRSKAGFLQKFGEVFDKNPADALKMIG